MWPAVRYTLVCEVVEDVELLELETLLRTCRLLLLLLYLVWVELLLSLQIVVLAQVLERTGLVLTNLLLLFSFVGTHNLRGAIL